MPFDPKEFGARLKAYRENQHLTQSELAIAIYTNRSTISRWESGSMFPDVLQLHALCIELKVPISTLVYGDCSRDMTLDELEREIAQVYTLLGVLMLRYAKLSAGK